MQNYLKSPLIDVHQLKDILKSTNIQNIRILDCTIPSAKGSFLYKRQRIPNSLYFDLAELRDPSSNLTMTFPKLQNIGPFLRKFKINKNNLIICYDQYGIYSAPRAWFIFKAYDFPNVFVLNGGFPKWVACNYEIEKNPLADDNIDINLNNVNDERAVDEDELTINESFLSSFDEVVNNTNTNNAILMDTRHSMNFKLDCIPNSINIPFMSFINQDHTMKNKEELEDMCQEYGVIDGENRDVISSCGIGLSACVGVLALRGVMGKENVKLYDGSFEEFSIKC